MKKTLILLLVLLISSAFIVDPIKEDTTILPGIILAEEQAYRIYLEGRLSELEQSSEAILYELASQLVKLNNLEIKIDSLLNQNR